MAIHGNFLNLSTTSNHLHPLQGENCDSNSQLVVGDDNGKFRLERVKELNVLKIDGMFKLQPLTFCFDLINNNLPAYFITMSSLLQPVIYHHNIRQKRNYSVTSVARVKHVFAQKCMRFCIPDILNKSSSLITDKIKTHSRKGFSVYILNVFL